MWILWYMQNKLLLLSCLCYSVADLIVVMTVTLLQISLLSWLLLCYRSHCCHDCYSVTDLNDVMTVTLLQISLLSWLLLCYRSQWCHDCYSVTYLIVAMTVTLLQISMMSWLLLCYISQWCHDCYSVTDLEGASAVVSSVRWLCRMRNDQRPTQLWLVWWPLLHQHRVSVVIGVARWQLSSKHPLSTCHHRLCHLTCHHDDVTWHVTMMMSLDMSPWWCHLNQDCCWFHPWFHPWNTGLGYINTGPHSSHFYRLDSPSLIVFLQSH